MSIKMFFARKIVAVISFFEIAIFLLKNRSIFKNKIIYVTWTTDFGHSVMGFNAAARLFYPNRISGIYMHNPYTNPDIGSLFEYNVDPFVFKGMASIDNWSIGNIAFQIMLFVLTILSTLSNKKFMVVDIQIFYRMLSLADQELLFGTGGSQMHESVDYSGFTRLLRDKIGKKPSIPESLSQKCRKEIVKVFPHFFDKPFVTLLLRSKGAWQTFGKSLRCAGPHQNYRDAVKLLINEGYHVAGIMETEHEAFADIDGYFNMGLVAEKSNVVDNKTISLFFTMNCSLFIGQQSGGNIIPSICDIPSLICDAAFYNAGTLNPHDIIMYKHFIIKEQGKPEKRLSYVDVYKEHEDLTFGEKFKEETIRVEPLSSGEIVIGVKEMLARINGTFKLTKEDKMLCEKYEAILPKNMCARYQKNRPPIEILRRMKKELLGDQK